MAEKKFVSNKDESVRMFKSPILESLTRVHFTVPLYIFVPVILYFFYKAIFEFHINFLLILAWFALGIFIWTFVEYVLHRFVFHWQPPGKLGERIHFIFHGVHHDYPRDSKRLVMVPTVSIPLATLFYFLFDYMFGGVNVAPLYCGFMTGYLFYDITHYAVHHINVNSRFFHEIKRRHMGHHFRNDDTGYGVTSPLWDIVFRTTTPNCKASLQQSESSS